MSRLDVIRRMGRRPRGFLGFLLTISCLSAGSTQAQPAPSPLRRPNIVLIMADDQGYGDLGVHGNPKIKTPRLDRFAHESVRLKSFHVSPVCAPTRASLLTGRYNYRTGVVDTYQGRAIMHPDETTLAEMLAKEGYRTGIFGKWHLGDNAPCRPIDQGFQESLVIKGGGLGQPSDPAGGGHYLDPILQHNGRPERSKGYCSDVFTTAAISFAMAPSDRPFFVYLPFNCVHDPLEAPERELKSYASVDLSYATFPPLGLPIPQDLAQKPEDVAKVYAMATNIDTNVGRLLDALDSRGLANDTIVVFLTDNGPAQFRFNAGLRGRKASVYDGGIHVPCYIRWPGQFRAGLEIDRIAAHIDLAPTLLAACAVPAPAGVAFDGVSLLPLLRGELAANWPDRTLFFQWHRGDAPERGRAFAARSQRYKLVRPEPPAGARPPALALFDMEHDPLEQHDIAGEKPALVARMQADYLDWFEDVSSTRGYGPIRIHLGGPRENPTVLTPQDWRGATTKPGGTSVGGWEVQVMRPGRYQVKTRLKPRPFPTVARLSLGGIKDERRLEPGATECVFSFLTLSAGPARLEAFVEGNETTFGVLDATVLSLGD